MFVYRISEDNENDEKESELRALTAITNPHKYKLHRYEQLSTDDLLNIHDFTYRLNVC
uniref:Uncharacterized protein n=1 Tax=Heterorhabditis bacteriophora TaxID=37862 RepID=A0A1I7W6C7_HETBA